MIDDARLSLRPGSVAPMFPEELATASTDEAPFSSPTSGPASDPAFDSAFDPALADGLALTFPGPVAESPRRIPYCPATQ